MGSGTRAVPTSTGSETARATVPPRPGTWTTVSAGSPSGTATTPWPSRGSASAWTVAATATSVPPSPPPCWSTATGTRKTRYTGGAPEAGSRQSSALPWSVHVAGGPGRGRRPAAGGRSPGERDPGARPRRVQPGGGKHAGAGLHFLGALVGPVGAARPLVGVVGAAAAGVVRPVDGPVAVVVEAVHAGRGLRRRLRDAGEGGKEEDQGKEDGAAHAVAGGSRDLGALVALFLTPPVGMVEVRAGSEKVKRRERRRQRPALGWLENYHQGP